MDTNTKYVKVGSETFGLAPFRAFKAVYAGNIVASVSTEVQQLLSEVEEFERDYAQTHRIRLTRDIAEAGGYTLPEGQDHIDLPATPSNEQKVMRVFGKAFEIARDEVMQLLALIVIPNETLMQADQADRVEQELLQIGRNLLYEAEMGEILDLLVAAVEQVQDQLKTRKETVGKLRALFGVSNSEEKSSQTTPPDGGTNSTDETWQGPPPEPRVKVATVTPSPISAESSTNSAEPMDGVENTPSTEFPIKNSASSVTS